MMDALFQAMIRYHEGDPKRIQHFIKVHSLAALIGRGENLPADVQYILELAALVHDIGIKPAEQQYGRCDGKLQEELGPNEAERMLNSLGVDAPVVQRVCWLVGHHHTYTGINAPDWQILVEADFLVNLYEDGCSTSAVRAALCKIFRTQTGKKLCYEMFGLASTK